MNRPITGYHVAAIFIGFFGIVIAVNLVMATFATTTFGGKLAENGYVASQDYNRFIAESVAQDRLGWSVAAAEENGHLVIDLKGVREAEVNVVAIHPLGVEAEVTPSMMLASDGEFRSVDPLPAGRWKLHITVTAQGKTARFLDEVGG